MRRYSNTPCECGCGEYPSRGAKRLNGHGPFRSIEERLWENVNKTAGPDACWPWTASVNTTGYGQLHLSVRPKKMTPAHRVAWEVANGPVPDGLVVRHACDNPPCCNPAHLSVGTQGDNNLDAYDRGRRPSGEAHPQAVLPDEAVRYIRKNYARYSSNWSNAPELAIQFGISQGYVVRVARGLERTRTA